MKKMLMLSALLCSAMAVQAMNTPGGAAAARVPAIFAHVVPPRELYEPVIATVRAVLLVGEPTEGLVHAPLAVDYDCGFAGMLTGYAHVGPRDDGFSGISFSGAQVAKLIDLIHNLGLTAVAFEDDKMIIDPAFRGVIDGLCAHNKAEKANREPAAGIQA